MHAAADDSALIERFLAHAQFEKRLAASTLTLYRGDLVRLHALAAENHVALTVVQPHHMRRWMANMHNG